MPHDSNSQFLFPGSPREARQAERREERFEALMLQSWMLMRAKAERRTRENA